MCIDGITGVGKLTGLGLKVSLALIGAKLVMLGSVPAVVWSQDFDVFTSVQEAVQEHRIPGMSVAVIGDNRVVSAAAYGVRKVGSEAGVTIDDSFYIGSITKPFTAALMYVLDQHGILPISTRLLDVFPELREVAYRDYDSVTVRELLEHSSGMAYSPAGFPPGGYNTSDLSAAERRFRYTRHAVMDEPLFPPGEGYEYGGGSISAAAMAERVTGLTWEALMKQFIFRPLGITSAGFGFLGAPGVSSAVWGHALQGDAYQPVTQGRAFPTWTNAPAGSHLHMSAVDVATFILANMGNNPQRPVLLSRQRLFDMQTLARNGRIGPGWGVSFSPWSNYHTVQHGGDNGQGIAMAAFAPQFGMGYVILVNASGNAAWTALNEVQGQIQRYLQSSWQHAASTTILPFATEAMNYRGAVTGSNVWRDHPSFVPEKALDGDVRTRWATDERTEGLAYLVVDLHEPQTIGSFIIREEFSPRVTAYRIQVRSHSHEEWYTVANGGRLTQEMWVSIDEIDARYVRLELEFGAVATPTLSGFYIFPPGFAYNSY